MWFPLKTTCFRAKTGKTRILYLSSLQELFQNHTKDLEPKDYLFPSTKGGLLEVNTVYQIFQKVTLLLDRDDIHFFDKGTVSSSGRFSVSKHGAARPKKFNEILSILVIKSLCATVFCRYKFSPQRTIFCGVLLLKFHIERATFLF